MRDLVDAPHIERFMEALGRATKADGRVYLAGGATAEERSPLIRRVGTVSFHHFDPIAQALSKAERGHEQDLRDIGDLIASGLVDPADARAQFDSMEPELYRFPAIDPASFRRSVEQLFG